MLRDVPIEPNHPLVVDLRRMQQTGPGPYDLQVVLEVPFVARALAETDAEASGSGSASLELMIQTDGRMLVRGRVNAAFTVPCARCLEPADVDAGGELVVTFVPSEPAPDVEQEQDDGDWMDEPDQITYDGHVIDLAPLVAEHILLAYPIRALCPLGEACLGLCSGCGTDLNEFRPIPLGPATACPTCKMLLSEQPANARHEGSGMGTTASVTPESHQAGSEEGEEGTPAEQFASPWQRALRKLKSSGWS